MVVEVDNALLLKTRGTPGGFSNAITESLHGVSFRICDPAH